MPRVGSGQVHDAYSRAIERAKESNDFTASIGRAWFSDTFVLYSSDDSLQSYVVLELVAHNFFLGLVLDQIPSRGALVCDRAYFDLDNSVVFGRAIVEAYRYGDAQDWLGFIHCPSAVQRLRPEELPSLLDHVETAIPWSPGRRPQGAPDRLPAFVIGRSGSLNGKNPFTDNLHAMLSGVKHEAHREKYERTLAFIAQHDTLQVATNGKYPWRTSKR